MSATLLLLLLLPLPTQQPVEDPEAKYRAEYAKYTELAQMTDAAAQAEAYLAFLEEGFDERLLGGVLQGIQNDLAALTSAGETAKVYELADAWSAQGTGGIQATALAFTAAAGAGDSANIVKYGEPIYEVNPDPQIALTLANAYAQVGNDAKVMEYGTISIDNLELADTWSLAYAILGQHDGAGRLGQAAAMARRLQQGVRSAPSGVSASQWGEIQLYLQDTIARNQFTAERWPQAMAEWRKLLSMSPRSDKAYYFIAECLLKTNEINDSMTSYAKAYLLDGGYSARSYDMLETIYKANTGGRTEGMDDVIERARRELNRGGD